MKVGFSGSRDGMSFPQKQYIETWISKNIHNIEEVHHGDCIGADAQFHKLCNRDRLKIIIHPPSNPQKRAFCQSLDIRSEKPYLIRNDDIVNDSDILLATPSTVDNNYILTSGTWYTIRKAKNLGKEVIVIYPDGKVIRYITKNLKADYTI